MENINLSDKSKEALKSETWQELGETLREEIVKEYLKAGYAGESKQCDIEVSGTTYKVLERGEITTFYDGLGNTLFNVENKELVAKYEELMKAGNGPDPMTEKRVSNNVAEEKNVDLEQEEKISEDDRSVKLLAKEKLEKEIKADKDKTFAEPVIGYLLKRCEEDLGLAQDVVQEHKTWKKCFDYIYEQARKQAKGNRVAVRDDVVYEWAEDYYHKDDKAEEEKKAKEDAERKKKEKERKKKAAEQKKANKKNPKQATKKEEKTEEKSVEPPRPKRNPKEMDGQMDLFSMMGM